jgi:hypothetical protein
MARWAGVGGGPIPIPCAAMGVILTLIAGLTVWIVLWAIGAKSFDAFMITGLMLVLAAAGHLLAPHLPGRRGR